MGVERIARIAISLVAVVALTAPDPALGAFNISDFTVSPSSAPAGSHPDSTVSMSFGGADNEDVKDIIQHFPGGIIPNPEALPKCTPAQLDADLCPAREQARHDHSDCDA